MSIQLKRAYDKPSVSDGTRVRPYFCPGRSLKLVHAMARSIASAQKRVRVCSPVIT